MKYSLPKSLIRLVDEFKRLPGIGEKSAIRLAYYYLRKKSEDLERVSDIFLQIKDSIKDCSVCHNYTDNPDGICDICRTDSRNSQQIMVVEQPFDVATIENSEFYNGLYHVLRGSISPLNGIGPDQLTINDLLGRVRKRDLEFEIIIATSTNLEGEATSAYIQDLLKDVDNIVITTLARGLPSGAEIDYADKNTIKNAFTGRK